MTVAQLAFSTTADIFAPSCRVYADESREAKLKMQNQCRSNNFLLQSMLRRSRGNLAVKHGRGQF